MSAWERIARLGLAVLVLGLAPVGTAFAQVKVTAATPASAVQGTVSLDVVVSGSGFDASAKAQYLVSGTTNPGGITVKKVVFRNSRELITTIDVADAAALANFDIQVTLDSGRKGKGTTLFSVKAKPNPSPQTPPPPPTYPPPRFWHALTSNGGVTKETSRLYMLGGNGAYQNDWQDFSDLWVYTNAGSSDAAWTYISPGTSAPGPRHHVGWSCGGGYCIASNGVLGSALKETWVFAEATRTWSQVSCNSRRVVCPSARYMATMAYDPAHGTHVLFGGRTSLNVSFDDTYTFHPGTMTWVSHGSGSVPSPRGWAAAAYVPPLGRVVLFGGMQGPTPRTLNDMYSWTGSAWVSVDQAVDATLSVVPSLQQHSIAWDPTNNRLVVAGGTTDGTPNAATFYVTFSSNGGAWTATWTRASGIGCQASSTSPPDTVIYPEVRMAFDVPSGVQVFFGGGQNLEGVGAYAYGNTVECR